MRQHARVRRNRQVSFSHLPTAAAHSAETMAPACILQLHLGDTVQVIVADDAGCLWVGQLGR